MIVLINIIMSISIAFFQNTIVPRLSIQGVYIDFVMLYLVFVALRRPAFEAVLWGALAGFVMDMFVPDTAGAMMLGYALAGFILSNSRESFNLDRPLLHGVAILIVSLIQKFLILLFSGFRIDNVGFYILVSLISVIITAILAILLDIVIRLIFGKVSFTIMEE